MTWIRLPKTKKSYHSNVVPAAEAATTVRNEGGFFPARSDVSAAISTMMLPPKPREASSPNGVVKVG